MSLKQLISIYCLAGLLLVGLLITPMLSPDYLPAKEKDINGLHVHQKIFYGYKWTIITEVTKKTDSMETPIKVYESEILHRRDYTFGRESERELKEVKRLAKDEWNLVISQIKNRTLPNIRKEVIENGESKSSS